MVPSSRLVLALALLVLSPSAATAHRGLRRGEAIDGPTVPRADADALATSAAVGGGGVARRRMPPVIPPLSAGELRAALEATRADLDQCLVTAALTGALRVTARISLAHSLALDITTPRADAASHDCAELVLRRALTTLAARPITRAMRASLTVRHRDRPARVAPVVTPRDATSAFASPVHDAIERDRAAMLSCLSSAAPGLVGNASLRVTLAPDGSLTLSSATLPTGVPAGPALPCLSSRIAQLRFSPAPPHAMTIVHTLPLGL